MLRIPRQAVLSNNRSVVGAVLAKQKGMFARASSTIDSTTEPKRNFYSATTPVSPTIEPQLEPAATLVINDTTPKSVESKDSFNIDRQSNKHFNSEESAVSPSPNKEQLELSEIQLKPEEFGRLFSNFRDNASAVDSEQVIDILGNLIKKLGGTTTRATGSISLLEHRYNEFVKLLINKKFRDYQDGSTSFNVPQDAADEIMLVFAKLAEYDYEITKQPPSIPPPPNKEQPQDLIEFKLKPKFFETYGKVFSILMAQASSADLKQIKETLGTLIKKLGGVESKTIGTVSLLEHRYNEFVKLLIDKKFRDYPDGSVSLKLPQDVADEIKLFFDELDDLIDGMLVQPVQITPQSEDQKAPPAEKTPPVIGPTPGAEKTPVEIIEDETKKQADKLAAAAKEIAIKNKTGIIIGISLALLIYLATRGRK